MEDKELRVNVENINLESMRITPDDPCTGRRKITLQKEAFDTYRILGIPAKKKKRKSQTCPFCGVETADRYDLIRHCSRQHLKDHLMKYIDKDSFKCTFCGIERGKLAPLLFHLGAKHKRDEMEKLIDIEANGMDYQEYSGTHQEKEDNHNKCPKSSPEPETSNETIEFDKRLKCHLEDCSFETSKRSKLYMHYSKEHYKRQLVEHLNGDNSMTCKFCNILIRKKSDMIAHIGSVHGKVEKYLPKENRIPLSVATSSVSSSSCKPKNAFYGEIQNKENINSMTLLIEESSTSPVEQIVCVETVMIPPESQPSIFYPDEECKMKIEKVESVSKNSPSQIQEEKFSKDVPGKVTEISRDLRKILDSDSESENE